MRTPAFSKVSPKGQVTLPADIRQLFNIKTGQSVTFSVTRKGILVKPVEITVTDQTAKPDWERKLEAALEDVKEGRSQRFTSDEEFMDYLKKAGRRKAK